MLCLVSETMAKKIGGVCTTTTTKKLFPLTIFFVKSHENSQNDESNAPLMLWYVSKPKLLQLQL